MNDCTNLDIRDLLPEFARGALRGASLATVEQHLATCASCRAELTLVRNAQAVLGVTPPFDAARISSAVVRSGTARQIGRQRVWLAAASVAAIAAAATLVTSLTRTSATSDLASPIATVEEPVVETPILPSPQRGPTTTHEDRRVELVLGSGLNDLADADLESLLGALEGFDAHVDVEPAPVLPLLEGEV
jgi:hypothetical protein